MPWTHQCAMLTSEFKYMVFYGQRMGTVDTAEPPPLLSLTLSQSLVLKGRRNGVRHKYGVKFRNRWGCLFQNNLAITTILNV